MTRQRPYDFAAAIEQVNKARPFLRPRPCEGIVAIRTDALGQWVTTYAEAKQFAEQDMAAYDSMPPKMRDYFKEKTY